jgi:hypothetical protein
MTPTNQPKGTTMTENTATGMTFNEQVRAAALLAAATFCAPAEDSVATNVVAHARRFEYYILTGEDEYL